MSFSTPISTTKRVQFPREITKSVITNSTGIKRINGVTITPRSVKITKAAIPNLPNASHNSLDSMSSNYKSSDMNNLIRVGIRVRPANEKELAIGGRNVIRVDKEKNQIVLKDSSSKQHEFECDFIITDQESISDCSDCSGREEDSINNQQQYVYECAGMNVWLGWHWYYH